METQKKFEVGQIWYTYDERKYMILSTDIEDGGIWVFDYKYQCKRLFDFEGRYNWGGGWVTLSNQKQEPRSGFVWVNIYPNSAVAYLTELEAVSGLEGTDIIARIKMPWTEGEFYE